MKILITGGAGFIGSKLAKDLLQDRSNYVVVVDNFVLGRKDLMDDLSIDPNFKYYDLDAGDIEGMERIMKDHAIEYVYHLAANSDIQKGGQEPSIDFHDTFLTTYGTLEAMRRSDVKKIFFASTSAVYGELNNVSLREDLGGLEPISYYGASKLASESFISSYAYMNEMSALIFRFPNVIGPNLTHGVIYDFMNKLKNNSNELEILGDGTQQKPYIYVDDLVEAIIKFSCQQKSKFEIYNIGVADSITVREIADIVCDAMNLKNVKYKFTGGDRGWKGDVPKFIFDLTKIKHAGYEIKNNSYDAVVKTAENQIRA